MVGETGPELMRLPSGAQVAPLRVGGGFTLKPTLNVSGANIGIDDLEEHISEAHE